MRQLSEEEIQVDLREDHPEDVIIFMVAILGLGILVLFLVNLRGAQIYHLKVFLPYTVLIFVGAFVLELIEKTGVLGETLGSSIRLWLRAEPELILFVFLPALLFNDAMALDIHLWSKKLLQCLVLAVPGVVIGTFLTALFLRLIMPEWPWLMDLILGSILSATDPVAVVALLKSLGAPKELTMIITGESLLNDGVAVVLFELLFLVYLHDLSDEENINPPIGEEFSVVEVVEFFSKMAIVGPLIGILFGFGCIEVLKRTKHGEIEDHHIAQLAATIATAYSSFYVSQRVAHSSGVLACVSAALILAWLGWPLFTDSNTIKHVWHSAEFFANTLIFGYAGLVSGSVLINSGGALIIVKGIALYAVVVLVRFVTIVALYPLLWYLDRKDPIAVAEDVLGFGDGMPTAPSKGASRKGRHRNGSNNPPVYGTRGADVSFSITRTVSEKHLISKKRLFDFSFESFYPSSRTLGFKDVLVMTWGGLRGAVGLALALLVSFVLEEVAEVGEEEGNEDLEDQKRRGQEVLGLFVIVCLLTLVVNAPSTPALVNLLGLHPQQTAIERVFLQKVVAKLHDESKKDYRKMVEHYVLPPSWSRKERQVLKEEQAREIGGVEAARSAYAGSVHSSMPSRPRNHGAHNVESTEEDRMSGVISFLSSIRPRRLAGATAAPQAIPSSVRRSISFHNPRQQAMCESMYERSLNHMLSELVERRTPVGADRRGSDPSDSPMAGTIPEGREDQYATDPDAHSVIQSEDGSLVDARWKTSDNTLTSTHVRRQTSSGSFDSVVDQSVQSPRKSVGGESGEDGADQESAVRRSISEKAISFSAKNVDLEAEGPPASFSYSTKDLLASGGSALRKDPRYMLEMGDSEKHMDGLAHDPSIRRIPRKFEKPPPKKKGHRVQKSASSSNIFVRPSLGAGMDPKSFRSTTSNNLWRRRGGQGKRRAGVSSTHGRGASSSRSSKARSSSWSVPKLDDVLTVFGWEDDGVTEFSARDFEEPEDNFLNETMSIIDEELQSEGLDKFIREVFLHLVRAKYWDFIKAEVLPRGEMSTNVLLHSVDHALDFTTDGLFDFDYFRYKIGKKDWGAWGLTQLDYLWKVAFGSVSVAELLEEERRKDARRDRASFLSRSRSAFKGHKDEQHLTPKGKVFSSENNISAFQSARHLEDFDEVGDEEKGISGEQSGFRPPNLSGESYESEEDKPQIRYLSRLLNTVSGSWTKVDQKECREYSQEHIQQLEELLRTPVKAKYPHLANSKSACLHGLVLRLRTIEASRQADRYFGINAFVRAHMSAQEDVLRYFGSSESVAEHLKETIIRESKKSVAKAKRFLDETIDPHVVIRERWIQFAEIAIGTKRKHLQELTDQGMISDSNFEDIDEDLRQKLDDLRIMRHNIDRIFALREDEMEMEEIAERKQRRDNVLLRTLQRGAESIFGAATFRAQNTSVESFASVGSPKAQAPALSPVNEVQNPGHEAPEVKEAGMVTDVEVAELHDL